MPASRNRRWTLKEVHALPDDQNTYELIDGELFVTPEPSGDRHGTICARLARILTPYVLAQNLGHIYFPRSVFRVGLRVQVEPDLMVRLDNTDPRGAWEKAPLPNLVVEVLSNSTGHYERTTKRNTYLLADIPEYWVVDARARTFTVFNADREPVVVSDQLTWSPARAREPLTFAVAGVFP